MLTPQNDLDRFVEAQRGVYDRALIELRRGRKESHWMWFIFPQLRGLGSSANSHYYGIADTAEARAYLTHPVLGPRLRECAAVLLAVDGRSALEIFGTPDQLKLRSSMTLFAGVAEAGSVFDKVLQKFWGLPSPADKT